MDIGGITTPSGLVMSTPPNNMNHWRSLSEVYFNTINTMQPPTRPSLVIYCTHYIIHYIIWYPNFGWLHHLKSLCLLVNMVKSMGFSMDIWLVLSVLSPFLGFWRRPMCRCVPAWSCSLERMELLLLLCWPWQTNQNIAMMGICNVCILYIYIYWYTPSSVNI